MDISSRYYGVLASRNTRVLAHLWSFFVSIYRVGKLAELISFCLWEFKHQLRLYPKKRYLLFNNSEGIQLESLPKSTAFQTTDQIQFVPLASDWRFCVEDHKGSLWGSLFSDTTALYRAEEPGSIPRLVNTFPAPIDSLFISRCGVLFIASNGLLYRSADGGICFTIALRLSSSISYFLYNNGMTELPNQVLLLGEYGSIWSNNSWQNLAFLYYSVDAGQNWLKTDFLQRNGVNKHIHVVRYSQLLKAILLTDGDNKKQFWLNPTITHFSERATARNDGWQLVNRFHHQMGGYISVAESVDKLLLGSDYLGGTNFLVRTHDGKSFERSILPDPYRRSPIMNMVTRQTEAGQEVWAVTYSCLSSKNRCLLMYSKDQGKTWTKVIDFDGTRSEVRIVSSSVNSSNRLYISITHYGNHTQDHTHAAYELRHSVNKT